MWAPYVHTNTKKHSFTFLLCRPIRKYKITDLFQQISIQATWICLRLSCQHDRARDQAPQSFCIMQIVVSMTGGRNTNDSEVRPKPPRILNPAEIWPNQQTAQNLPDPWKHIWICSNATSDKSQDFTKQKHHICAYIVYEWIYVHI